MDNLARLGITEVSALGEGESGKAGEKERTDKCWDLQMAIASYIYNMANNEWAYMPCVKGSPRRSTNTEPK